MTGKVFLNYRRTDAEAWADRLFERLVRHFPRENVFMDIDGHIPVGFPWADWLDSQVATCDLMLVLIGRTWAAEFEARSEAGGPDYVRVEIESALKRRIPVVPVFLGDAPAPRAAELPETIHPLLGLQAARLNRTSFDSDAETLAKAAAHSIALARGEAVASSPTQHRPSPRQTTEANRAMPGNALRPSWNGSRVTFRFEGSGQEETFVLPDDRSDKSAIRDALKKALEFGRRNSASKGQLHAIRKEFTDHGYHLTRS
jgi:hypothetical protein